MKLRELTGQVAKPGAARSGVRLLVMAALLAICGCVATGTGEFKDKGLMAKIEPGKSTKNDVAGLMESLPAAVTFGQDGEETWYYLYTSITPRATELLPALRAYTRDLDVDTRSYTFTFDREGIVKSLGPGPLIEISSADAAHPPVGSKPPRMQ